MSCTAAIVLEYSRPNTALAALKKDNSSSAFPFPPSHYLVRSPHHQAASHAAPLTTRSARLAHTHTCPRCPRAAQVTAQEMADNNYPLPVVEAATGSLVCPPGFVVTQPTGGGVADAAPAEMVALDCEMSYTAQARRGAQCGGVSALVVRRSTGFDSLVTPRGPGFFHLHDAGLGGDACERGGRQVRHRV